MPSMSYCRFQNFLAELREIEPHFSDGELSAEEESAREKSLEIINGIWREHLTDEAFDRLETEMAQKSFQARNYKAAMVRK